MFYRVMFFLLIFGKFFVKRCMSFKQHVDSPFYDPYPFKRWTFLDEKIADWDQLPISSPDASYSHYFYSSFKNSILLSENALYISKFTPNIQEWIEIDKSLNFNVTKGTNLIIIDEKGKFLLSTPHGIYDFSCHDLACEKNNFLSHKIGFVNDVIKNEHIGGDAIWIGSENGLFLYGDGVIMIIEGFHEEVNAISSIQKNDNGDYIVAIGTNLAVYLFENEEMDISKWHHLWVLSNIDNNVTALEFDIDGKLWIGNRDSINIYDVKSEMFSRIGGLQGLPYGNITKIIKTKEKMYVGCKKGLMVYNKEVKSWNYFYLDRWIHGEEIISIQTIENDGVLVVTEKGGGFIKWKHWTLQDKADFYEEMTKPRHDRYGLCSDVKLTQYADINSYVKVDSDNDGSWTCDYALGQIFAYASTKSEMSKKRAWEAFNALELLNSVTGIKGFTARSVLPIEETEHHSGGEWFNSTVMPWFQFKGNTSSDEIIGHILVYTAMYDYVVETEEERKRVVTLVDNIVSYIIDNDYWLMDYNTGKPTRWGCWNPEKLSNDPFWKEERGLNSIQMLSFVLNAYRMTGKEIFLESYEMLVNDYKFDWNILNQKLEVPINVDHSDDRLAAMSYLCLHLALKNLKDSKFNHLRDNLKKSIERNYQITKEEKSAYFDSIYAEIVQPDNYFEFSVLSLQSWPQSLINYPIDNTHRIDIIYNPEPLYRELLQNSERMKIIPYNERDFLRWNGNPWALSGGNGYAEIDPSSWIISYWMSRFFGLISPPLQKKSIKDIKIT